MLLLDSERESGKNGVAMLSERPWNLQMIPILLLGMLGSVLLGSLVMAVPDALGWPLSPNQKQLAMLVANAIFLHGAVLVIIAVFLRRNALGWREAFGFSRGCAGKMLGFGIGGAAVVLPVAWALNKLSAALIERFHGTPKAQIAVQYLQSEPYLPATLFMGFSTVLLAPVVEEMLFRGILYPSIKQAGYPRAALLGTSFLFAAYHSNLAIFPPLFLLAMVLVLVYEATDNLFTAILLHALFNAANYVVLVMGWDLEKLFRKLPFCGQGVLS
jgi:membrane protease YdiL (CAAX protease family)